MIAVEVSKNHQQFNCVACTHHHCDHDGGRPGSRGPAPVERWDVNGVIKSKVCLLPLITAFTHECLKLYRHYKNGVLLTSGGLYSQPNKYIKAMGVIDGLYNSSN